ncbi:MAG: hypothetical protein EBU46_09145 [Nitrosomonadaceae bacterium]|nr:hypothetical protein [Nitrosomonadaceae bacterium]
MPYKHKVPGIYLITNLVTGQCYVGSSTAVHDRLALHKTLLRKGTGHHNKHLQSSFTKYGEDAFTFELLERCPARLLEEREKYWISAYDSVDGGYNTSIDVHCPARGRKQSDAEIELRASMNRKIRKFLDPEGKVFETSNTREFAAQHGIDYEGLTAVACGRRFSFHGWRVFTPELVGRAYKDIRSGRPAPWFAKTYHLVDPAGAVIVVNNMSQFCKQHRLSHGTLSMVVSGLRNHHKGFRRVE